MAISVTTVLCTRRAQSRVDTGDRSFAIAVPSQRRIAQKQLLLVFCLECLRPHWLSMYATLALGNIIILLDLTPRE